MFGILFFVTIIFAILNWLAADKDAKILEYITKPGTMLALIAWMVFEVHITGPLVFFTLGFFLSLIGDVLLMLPREQFIGGLVAFLLAHGCYIIGFNFQAPPITAITVLLAVGVAVVAYIIIRPLQNGLLAKGQKALLLPVRIYAGVISLMLLSALVTYARADWHTAAAVLVSVGAVLFFTSDTVLAWIRFVASFPKSSLVVRVTYHLGQILIGLGAAIQFMK